MKPTRLNWSVPVSIDKRPLFPHAEHPKIGSRMHRLAKAFMKFRAAKLAADPSVDTFFNRGESATRFAYFDE